MSKNKAIYIKVGCQPYEPENRGNELKKVTLNSLSKSKKVKTIRKKG